MKRLVLLALCLPSLTAAGFDSGRAAFVVTVNDLDIPYRVFAVYALPGESLRLAVAGAASMTLSDPSGATPVSGSRHDWTAPGNPGLYPIEIAANDDRIRLNVLVMTPAKQVENERLNGFRIGAYPAKPLRGDPIYLPPDGFIELNENTRDAELSPHFRLSQFPSKQAPVRLPKYLVLREQLLIKLELLLEEVNRRGVAADSLTIMSGYRTPWYNKAIGNVPYSRHVYGGAADVYVDVSPRDDNMDDLNGDGRIDYVDAQLLYRWANALFRKPEHRSLAGGLGVYRRNAAHGPFLHIDARGQRARWGVLPADAP